MASGRFLGGCEEVESGMVKEREEEKEEGEEEGAGRAVKEGLI